MKTLQCDLCEMRIEGEDFDSWCKAAHAHWTSSHADAMKAMAGRPKEEGDKWMADAKAKFEACNNRRNEATKRNVEKMQKEGQAEIDKSHEVCKNAIRKLSSQPTTLSFDYPPRYEIINGLNASGMFSTDGGRSLVVSGSDINGKFRVACYMDMNFRVTHVR